MGIRIKIFKLAENRPKCRKSGLAGEEKETGGDAFGRGTDLVVYIV